MKVYVLDTNAFYYASGISQCTYDVNKLRKLINENEVFISSTSLFEFIIKYRNDIDIIHAGGKYIENNGISIAGNVLNPLPEGYSWRLSTITEQDLQHLCEDILNNKIDVESRFISLLFDMCLFSGYYFVALATGEEISDISFEVFTKVYKMFTAINLEVFEEIFREGYKTDDCENYVRKCFYNLLAFELEKGIPFIERAKELDDAEALISIDDFISEDDYSDATSKIARAMKSRTSTEYLQRLAIKYWKFNNDQELKKHIKNITTIFDKKVELTALQDYFNDTLEKILTSGAALWKNDFLDAIILCNVQNLHTMITYDNGVIERIRKRKDKYPKYAESINVIEMLKS